MGPVHANDSEDEKLDDGTEQGRCMDTFLGWIEASRDLFSWKRGKKAVICFHGYTSKGMSDYIGLSNYYLSRGYQMLLVDERAHGDSEGRILVLDVWTVWMLCAGLNMCRSG